MATSAFSSALDRTLRWPGVTGTSSSPRDGHEQRTDGERRLLLVDDHPFFRTTLRRLIDRQPDLKVCGEAADLVGAADLAARLRPDLILLDLSLGDADGLDLFPHLRESGLGATPVVVLSMHEDAAQIARAHAAGAAAYVPKSHDTARLLNVLRETLATK